LSTSRETLFISTCGQVRKMARAAPHGGGMFCAMRLWTIVLAGGLAMLLPCCKWAYTKIGETWVNRYASGQLREGGELRGKLKEGEWEFF